MSNKGICGLLFKFIENKKKGNEDKKIIYGKLPWVPLVIIIISIVVLLIIYIYIAAHNNPPFYINILKDLMMAVLGSFILVFALNINPPMQINDQLIIRLEESGEESDEKRPLTLSLMVGNKCRWLIGGLFDLKFTFIYYIDNGAKSNMAKAKPVERGLIHNYYRASVELKDMDEIEKSFWKDYLDPTNKNQNAIFVIISGSSNRFGNNFRYLVKYPKACILIGEDCIGALDKKLNSKPDFMHGKNRREFGENKCTPKTHYWEAFNLFYPYISGYESKEKDIRDRIQALICNTNKIGKTT